MSRVCVVLRTSSAAALIAILTSVGMSQDEIEQLPSGENVVPHDADTIDPAQDDSLPPLLDLTEIDTTEAEPFQFHGRVDLTAVWFEGMDFVDDFDRRDVLPLSPGLYFSYAFLERFEAVAEIEWDGLDEELELDRALIGVSWWERHLELRGGRDIVPFGVERLFYSPSRNVFVDRPAAFRVVFPGTFSDYGGFLSGHYDNADGWSVGLDVAVTLGLQDEFDEEGIENVPEENNRSKQFTGRLSCSPVHGLFLGSSYLISNYDDEDDLQYDFVGVDGRYSIYELNVRAEWVGGRVERLTDEGGSFYRHGWYAQVDRRWELPFRYPRAVQTAFRFDSIDPNTRERDQLDLRRYGLAVVFEIVENLRWKFQYSIQDERTDEINNDGVLTQIEFHW